MMSLFPGGTAMFSPCLKYRYELTRDLPLSHAPNLAPRRIVWLMMNPSTADAAVDDRTVAKCQRYGHRWKFTHLTVINIYAYRATYTTPFQRARARKRLGWQIGLLEKLRDEWRYSDVAATSVIFERSGHTLSSCLFRDNTVTMPALHPSRVLMFVPPRVPTVAAPTIWCPDCGCRECADCATCAGHLVNRMSYDAWNRRDTPPCTTWQKTGAADTAWSPITTMQGVTSTTVVTGAHHYPQFNGTATPNPPAWPPFNNATAVPLAFPRTRRGRRDPERCAVDGCDAPPVVTVPFAYEIGGTTGQLLERFCVAHAPPGTYDGDGNPVCSVPGCRARASVHAPANTTGWLCRPHRHLRL